MLVVSLLPYDNTCEQDVQIMHKLRPRIDQLREPVIMGYDWPVVESQVP